MSWLWIYWGCALAFTALILFAIPEYWALKYGGPTFSRWMNTVARQGFLGRLWILAWGMLIGGLAIHFLGWCVGCEN
jgi:hypothetical protein